MKNPHKTIDTSFSCQSELLLRFGIGLHPETMDQIVYATVERRPQGGKGSYMLLRKSLVDAIKKGGNSNPSFCSNANANLNLFLSEYRAVIRSQAKYRQDMPDYVQQKLCMYANECFNKVQAKSLCIPLQPNTKDAKSWKCDKSIQCILRLQNGSSFCELDHRIEAANEPIPCYNATQLWSKETVDALQNKYNAPAIGIIKSFESVDLAIALWRCRQYNS